jgi:hypothetical protein
MVLVVIVLVGTNEHICKPVWWHRRSTCRLHAARVCRVVVMHCLMTAGHSLRHWDLIPASAGSRPVATSTMLTMSATATIECAM